MKIMPMIAAIVMSLALAAAAPAQNDKKMGKELREAADHVNDASAVVNEIMQAGDKSIPRDLLDKAEAVVVFPGTVKAAFIVGGTGGSGVAVKRTGKGWSAPAFLKLAGGSIGPQIGGSKTDYILLIMNDSGMKSLLQDKFEIGAEGSVAAGPIGRTAAASTDAKFNAQILTYSRSKGLFAGVSLKGVSISHDNDKNRAIYQRTARQILADPPLAASDAPATLRALGDTLSRY